MNSNAFYVTPIRSDATPQNILYYDDTTKEITYGVNNGSGLGETVVEALAAKKVVQEAIVAENVSIRNELDVKEAYIHFNESGIATLNARVDNAVTAQELLAESLTADIVSNRNEIDVNKAYINFNKSDVLSVNGRVDSVVLRLAALEAMIFSVGSMLQIPYSLGFTED